jgi:hypothetical protein
MSNPEKFDGATATSPREEEKGVYENQFPFTRMCKDGTVGRYATQEEMTKAIEEERDSD